MIKKRFVSILTSFALTAALTAYFPQFRTGAAVSAAAVLPAAAGTVSQSPESNKDKIYTYLTATMGLSIAGACGVLGNIQVETGGTYSPDAFNGDDTGGTQSYGICQWNSGADRIAQLKAFTPDWNTLEGQLAFIRHDMENPYFKYDVLKAYPNTEDNAAEAAKLWAVRYEGCAPGTIPMRQEYARIHFRERTGSTGTQSENVTVTPKQWTAVNKTYFVSTRSGSLNMRSEPSVLSSILTGIPHGAEVQVIRTADNWGEVIWNGRTGFCSMDYLTEKTESAQQPQSTEPQPKEPVQQQSAVQQPQNTAASIPYPRPAANTVLQRGAANNSSDVKWLQAALNLLGSSLSVDGDFGPATEAAVKAFQQNHGLTEDGIAGELTTGRIAALLEAGGSTAAAQNTPMRGDANLDNAVSIEDAQRTLKAYANRIAGNRMELTDAQMHAADINADGVISVEDAQYILRYYTQKQVAGKPVTWDELLNA